MTARMQTIRSTIAAAINAAKSGYVLQPTVVEAYLPEEVEGALALTVYVIAVDFDETRETRKHRTIEAPIKIGIIQAPINPTDMATIDTLTELCEQIRKTISITVVDVASTQAAWSNTIADKDETGLPFSFVKMREAHTFESYFTAFFDLTVE